MSDFPVRPRSEMEKKRLKSVAVMKARDREEFDRHYEELCDRKYWTDGPCCAGCDHWRSDMGWIGECTAAAPVSGVEVMKSMGLTSCSYTPAPGHPYTNAEFVCGQFRDDFDWSTLEPKYLLEIGAMAEGVLKTKPGATVQMIQKEETK